MSFIDLAMKKYQNDPRALKIFRECVRLQSIALIDKK